MRDGWLDLLLLAVLCASRLLCVGLLIPHILATEGLIVRCQRTFGRRKVRGRETRAQQSPAHNSGYDTIPILAREPTRVTRYVLAFSS